MGNVLVGELEKLQQFLRSLKLKSEGFNIAVVTKGYAGEKLNLNNSPEIIPNDMPILKLQDTLGMNPR